MQNHSYENVVCLLVHFHANQTHFSRFCARNRCEIEAQSNLEIGYLQSRPQGPRSYWSAPELRPLRRTNFLSMRVAIVLHSQPMRFDRLDSEHKESVGKSVDRDFRCWTRPEVEPEVVILDPDLKERHYKGRERAIWR